MVLIHLKCCVLRAQIIAASFRSCVGQPLQYSLGMTLMQYTFYTCTYMFERVCIYLKNS